MERRLSAIFAADVAGYSRHMEADETGTLERVNALHRRIVAPAIARGKGRIVKLMGDGLLAEFPSVVEAVGTAVAIQSAIREENADLPQERRLEIRIGVHSGDVIVEGRDIFGDGVNVATRLEQMAEPGGVCLSGPVFDAVDGKVDAVFADAGEVALKNIARKVRVFRAAVPAGGGAATRHAGAAPSATPPGTDPSGGAPRGALRSLAILPFANMSGDPEQEYFSDGITEDLITEISRFRELGVISRNSSFVFKGRTESLRDVGRKLDADYIVEGSVRRAGDRIRVTAQLIDAAEDTHIWAERYDRDMEDIFAVQDDIVRRIAGTLADRVAAGRIAQMKGRPREDLEAYDLFLRGRAHFMKWSLEDNIKARELLARALELEPENAATLALMSETLLRTWLNGWNDAGDRDLDEAVELARQAEAVDDNDSRTQTTLGMVSLFHDDLDKAGRHFDAALRLNPNDTRVIVYYSRHAVFNGEFGKAVELCRQALRLNPYGKYSWNLGLAAFAARDYPEAVSLLRAVANPPATVLAILAASLAMEGRADAAAEAARAFRAAAVACPGMRDLEGEAAWRDYFSRRWPFRDPEDFTHLWGALREAGLGA